MMPFSLFLALKYLKPKRSYASIITIISVIGVMLGVAVLVIVLSVMSGFDEMWREKILSFNAHITVYGASGIEDEAADIARVMRVAGVRAAAPYFQGPVVIQHQGQIFTPVIRGVDPLLEPTVSTIPTNIVMGRYDLSGSGILIGRDLARRMNVRVGDKLLLNSPRAFLSKDEIHLPEEFVVTGIFEMGMWEFDSGFALCSLEMARELYGVERGSQALRVMTVDPLKAGEVAGPVQMAFGEGYVVETWMDQNRQLFGALRVEKNMMFFLLIFIAIVAAFGITNTLITVAVQKTREIGLLKAMGFSSGSIMGIFFWQGWIEGMIGTFSGIAAGLFILARRNDLMHWLASTFNLELFPKELYRLSEIPAKISAWDILLVASLVVVICTLAGFIPAYRAARLDPVKALRNE